MIRPRRAGLERPGLLGLACFSAALGCGQTEPLRKPPLGLATRPGAQSRACSDVPPGDDYTCAQQAGWGKCNEGWMQGYCDRSCMRCAEPCSDDPPDERHTCAAQAGWGKCDEIWMQGYCHRSCLRCDGSGRWLREMIVNPILPPGHADPWVIRRDGHYYAMVTTGSSLAIRLAPSLQGLGQVTPVVVWQAPGDSPYRHHIWAPELHFLDGKWWIFTSGSVSPDIEVPHRMFVLEATSGDPLGPYAYKGPLGPEGGIDETVFTGKDGARYLAWSRYTAEGQCIYVARMKEPWSLEGDGVRLSCAEHAWETRPDVRINEGPQFLRHGAQEHLIYSASGSWSEFYSLGMLTIQDGNYLNPGSWRKSPDPVFQPSERTRTFGVGHASFTTSPNGQEDWLVYHGMSDRSGGWADRSTRIQRFAWNPDGTPWFGEPVSLTAAIPAPR